MTTLKVVEVVNRGLENGLTSLTPHERDVFVIVDLDNYCDMDGGFENHMVSAPELFDWLLDTLQRIGDIASHSTIKQLGSIPAGPINQTSRLCDRYVAGRQFRLNCLERYLRAEGVELDWT